MRHIKNSARGSWQILWLLLLLVGLASFGLINSRNLLLNNARTLGSNLVSSYSNDEDSQLHEYDRILTMAMYYLEDMGSEGVDNTRLREWLTDYFSKSASLLQDVYAVLDGQVISAGGLRDADYDYESQPWYQKAIAAQGKVIFTDAYTSDLYGGQPVVTVAVSAAGSPNAVAFDVPVSSFRRATPSRTCPRGAPTTFWIPRASCSTITFPSPPPRRPFRSIPRTCSTGSTGASWTARTTRSSECRSSSGDCIISTPPTAGCVSSPSPIRPFYRAYRTF